LPSVAFSSRSTPAAAAASTAEPATDRMTRQITAQALAARLWCRVGKNSAAEPSDAVTSPAMTSA